VPEAGELIARDVCRHLAPLDGRVLEGQGLRSQERGCEQFMLAGDLDSSAHDVQRDAGVDHEPSHRMSPVGSVNWNVEPAPRRL
jgi:hypothetical protein